MYKMNFSSETVLMVTGGAGFIGSALVRHIINHTPCTVVVVDKLTYAGHMASLQEVSKDARFHFEKVDITNFDAMSALYKRYSPSAILHLAAESHVDRSIDGPAAFINTNIIGTYNVLETARSYWSELSEERKNQFRVLHVSTDEVYGTLGENGLFTEETPYKPNSPYSASKASSDHLARAWQHTFGLPVVVTNCSNNYGPYQFPEKLIPVVILNGLEGKEIPVYGKGENIRDWLFVEDHVEALLTVLRTGNIGEVYNIGGHNEIKNIDIVHRICHILDDLVEKPAVSEHASLITFVQDRPGHDFRYAIDASKIDKELDWRPRETFDTGIKKTVQWYLENLEWCNLVTGDTYNRERLGLIKQTI